MAVSRRRSAPVAKTNYDSDEDQIEYLNYNESKYYGYVDDFPSPAQVKRPNPKHKRPPDPNPIIGKNQSKLYYEKEISRLSILFFLIFCHFFQVEHVGEVSEVLLLPMCQKSSNLPCQSFHMDHQRPTNQSLKKSIKKPWKVITKNYGPNCLVWTMEI